MGKAEKSPKFAVMKKLVTSKAIKNFKEEVLNHNKKKEPENSIKNVPYVSSTLFFKYNTALGPPYRVLVDTNFINFSIQNKIELRTRAWLLTVCKYSYARLFSIFGNASLLFFNASGYLGVLGLPLSTTIVMKFFRVSLSKYNPSGYIELPSNCGWFTWFLDADNCALKGHMDYCLRELAGEPLPDDRDFHQCSFLRNID